MDYCTIFSLAHLAFIDIFVLLRLYSSAVFQHEFEEFSEAEILRRPIDDLLLQMKVNNRPFLLYKDVICPCQVKHCNSTGG